MMNPTFFFKQVLILVLSLMTWYQAQAQWVYSQGVTPMNGFPELQRINLNTYDFVRLTGMDDMGDIAFHPDGTLYGVIYDKIYEIDSLTGNAAEIYDLGDFQSVGMTIDYNGLMYFGGSDPVTNRFGVAVFDPRDSTTRLVADFGPITSGFINDLDFYNGELYMVGQLPPGYPESAVLYRVDTTGTNMHDTITTYTMWPGRAIASISDSCGSQFLVSPSTSLLNFFKPALDSIRQVDIIPSDGLFYSAGASSRTSHLGSIPPLRIANIDIDQDPCGSNTIVTVEIQPGRPPAVQYSLDGSSYQSNAVFTNVSPGIYQAFVRDDWGCSQMSDPFEVADIGAQVTLQTTPASCDEDNATIFVDSADPAYEYALDDMNFSTNPVFLGLDGGAHALFIRNELGCIDTIDVALDIIPSPDFTLTAQPEQCNVMNGQIAVIDLTGLQPFEYSLDGLIWQAQSVFDNISAGTYTVFVKDFVGCVVQKPVLVSVTGNPAIIEIQVSLAQCGVADGTIVVVATSDLSSLEFALNGSQYSTNPAFSGLSAGTYLVSVRDSFGCIVEQNVTINSVEGPVITDVSISPEHCGMADATIMITATSAFGMLQYAIDGGALSDNSNFVALSAGTYQVAVQDTNLCITQLDVTIEGIPEVKIQSLVTDDATCNMDNGAILVIVSMQSEINGYALDKVNYQGSPMFSDLSAGNYTVYLRSHDVCLDSASTLINTKEPPVIEDILVTPPRCNEDIGSVSIVTKSDSGTLYYSLDGGTSLDTNSTFTGLSSGEYLLTVRDMSGCVVSEMFFVATQGGPVILSIESTHSGCGESSGTMEIDAEGENLDFKLDDILTNEDGRFSDLSAGMHHLVITDDHGCVVDSIVFIQSDDCDVFVPNVFSPNGDNINDNLEPLIHNDSGQIYIFEIFDRWGNVAFFCQNSNACVWDGKINGEPAPVGVYVWRLLYNPSSDTQKELIGSVTVLR